MQNFTAKIHKHTWMIATVIALAAVLGIVWSFTTISAATSNTTFSVTPSSVVDCSDPINPKTKVYFGIEPSTSGVITLVVGSLDYDTFSKGETYLPNGPYTWAGIENANPGVSVIAGNFLLDAMCTISTSSADTMPSAPLEVSAIFSVLATAVVDCALEAHPKTSVSFNVSPSEGGSFNVVSSDGVVTNLKEGSHPFFNGSYSWSAVPSTGYIAVTPPSRSFSLSSTCSKVDPEPIKIDVEPIPIVPSAWFLKTTETSSPIITFTDSVTFIIKSEPLAVIKPMCIMVLIK